MHSLDKIYRDELDEIIEAIQESEELTEYLDTEESEHYDALRDLYEPVVADLYRKVATEAPLQLPAFEDALLDEGLEGLFLPKLLGFTVLRGPVDENYHYHYPQEDFRKVLWAIVNSTYFEELKKRIGQSIQIGFALSSHIWVSNLLAEIENKQVKQFLQSQVQERYYMKAERQEGYRRYALQFRNEIYFTAPFPQNLPELKSLFPAVRYFLGKRFQLNLDNSTLLEPMYALVNNEELVGAYEHLYLMTMFLNFFDPTPESKKKVGNLFNKLRKQDPEFAEKYFTALSELHRSKYDISGECDRRVSSVVDKKTKDDIADYYDLADQIHGKGYIHADVIELVAAFYSSHPGVGVVNECLRLTIYNYLRKFLTNLDTVDYPELFEISKVYAAYARIFDNEHFKQDIRTLMMAYLRKLIATYTDKRGRDYQDIKRFVATVFVDLGFMTDKEVVEFFKTRRKRPAPAE
jgi:hypothetical protein